MMTSTENHEHEHAEEEPQEGETTQDAAAQQTDSSSAGEPGSSEKG